MSDVGEPVNGHWSTMPIESLVNFLEFIRALKNETRPIDWDSTIKTIIDASIKLNNFQFYFEYRTMALLVSKRAPMKFLQRVLPQQSPSGDCLYEKLLGSACHGDSTDAETINFLLDKLRDNDDPLWKVNFVHVDLATMQVIAQHPNASFRLRHANDILNDFAGQDDQQELIRKIEFIMDHAVDRLYVSSPCMLHRFIGNFCSGDSRQWPFKLADNLKSLVTSILEYYPNEVYLKDSDGNLPLTLVCERMTGWYADPNDSDYECFKNEYESASIVSFLLEAYPEAALVPTNTGKLAIHLAIENGLLAADILADKAPPCLEIPCPTSGLYPAPLAAIDWPLHKPDSAILETIYNLIWRSPMVVARASYTFVSCKDAKKQE